MPQMKDMEFIFKQKIPIKRMVSKKSGKQPSQAAIEKA